MGRYLLAAVAAAAISSPALARDGSPYVGVDVGALLADDTKFDFEDLDTDIDNAIAVNYENFGIDIGLVGGHDFGMFRVEGELAYKRASVEEVHLSPQIEDTAEEAFIDADGRTSVLSAMANALIDIGDENSWSGFLGGGVGIARVKSRVEFSGDFPTIPATDFGFSDSDSAVAWQLLAGVRTALSPNIDLGLKYRFFNVRSFEFHDSTTDAELEGKFRSHSLMASLTYNFYTPAPPPAPPPPPPPAPPPPATQTCPDGSVILATEACPAPPPPPPPPPPAPERG
jgi:opacity protein-like surface antigen